MALEHISVGDPDHAGIHNTERDAINDSTAITGTASELSSDNPTPEAGQGVYATDTQELAYGDGSTPWVDLPRFEPSGYRELAYAESIVAQDGIGNTITDLTGLRVDFEVVSRPVLVSIYLPWVTASATGGLAIVYLRDVDDSSTIAQTNSGNITGASLVATAYLEHRFSTPGLYSVKASLNRIGAPEVGNNADLDSLTSNIKAVEL